MQKTIASEQIFLYPNQEVGFGVSWSKYNIDDKGVKYIRADLVSKEKLSVDLHQTMKMLAREISAKIMEHNALDGVELTTLIESELKRHNATIR